MFWPIAVAVLSIIVGLVLVVFNHDFLKNETKASPWKVIGGYVGLILIGAGLFLLALSQQMPLK